MSQRNLRRSAYRRAGISSEVPEWVPTGVTGQPERRITATTMTDWRIKSQANAETAKHLKHWQETGEQPVMPEQKKADTP